MTEPAITLNTDASRFETVIDGITAYLSFVMIRRINAVVLKSTYTKIFIYELGGNDYAVKDILL